MPVSDEEDWISFTCSASFGLGTDLGITCSVDVDMEKAFEAAKEETEDAYNGAVNGIDQLAELLFWESHL